MGHYAKVVNGKVVKVIVAEASYFKNFVDDSPGKWIKTSYNTKGGIHYDPNTNIPSPVVYYNNSGSLFTTEQDAIDSGILPITGSDTSKTLALRGNYAGVDYTYDSKLDVFYAPQPYPSWILNDTTYLWEPPIPYPQDGKIYTWDEETLKWIVVE